MIRRILVPPPRKNSNAELRVLCAGSQLVENDPVTTPKGGRKGLDRVHAIEVVDHLKIHRRASTMQIILLRRREPQSEVTAAKLMTVACLRSE